jgi:hypothetical protein
VADRARAASYRTDLDRWEGRVADLQDQVRTAAAELLNALSARGHPAASPAQDELAVAVTEHRQACDRRAGQARQASRRADLAAQLEARQQQEHRADTDRREREAAAALVTGAAAACGLPAGPAETAAVGLEKWLVQRSEATAAADKARQQAAELKALLNGRSPDELTRDAENTRHRTTELVARADPVELLVPEWRYLQMPALFPQQSNTSGLMVTEMSRGGGLHPRVARVVAVNQMKKINAVLGFTRLDEVERVGDRASRLVKLCRSGKPAWVSATEDRGEGIFLQLDMEAVTGWEQEILATPLWEAHRRAH